MLAAVLSAAALAAPAPAPAVPFRTVARGDGATSAVTERTVRPVSSATAWRRLWQQLHAGESPRPPVPAADFARSTLVLVTAGAQPSGGHAIRVRSIARQGRRLVVRAEELEPGDGCFGTAVRTAPWQVVRVRRTSARVSAVRRTVAAGCRRARSAPTSPTR